MKLKTADTLICTEQTMCRNKPVSAIWWSKFAIAVLFLNDLKHIFEMYAVLFLLRMT